jgi:shikimate dehydrogenase
MDQRTELIRLALFGRPIKSSLSPSIHRMFAGQFGLDIDYQLIETGPEEFPGALETFRSEGGIGCNVTLPLKRDAWQLATGSSTEVSLAQAANTLIDQASGWFAHTTDGAGLVTDLTLNNDFQLKDQRILILGAGGATAGVLGNLLACKPREITLVNRSEDRARALAERFKSLGKLNTTPWQDLQTMGASGQGGFNLVINATSLGHHGQSPLLARTLFATGALCYDLNYFKASLPLKNHCEEIAQSYVDGLGMLVEQAARSFYIWTGKRPETRVVIDACQRDTG